MVPIQIRSQFLRRRRFVPDGALGALALVPGDAAAQPGKGATGRWRQADVRRAIAAAEQAGLASYRVEIAPDGTIAIIVGEVSETAAPDPNAA